MHDVAVILAGGIGSRVGGNVPKQLLPLNDGRSVLEHAVDAFEQAPDIEAIVIVMHSDWMAKCEEMLLLNAWQKVVRLVPGGKERWESSVHAIEAVQEWAQERKWQVEEVNVLLHDAARPFVSQRIIADVCAALETHEAVSVAVPCVDTMYNSLTPGPSPEGEGDKYVAEIPDRRTIMRAQTPQSFRLEVIRQAYDQMPTDVVATDDCGVVHSVMPHIPIYIVAGEERNRKITYAEDME